MTKINGACTKTPQVEAAAGYPISQKHAVEFLDAVETADGRTLPAGTTASILSSGSLNGRPSVCLSLWATGEQVHVYC